MNRFLFVGVGDRSGFWSKKVFKSDIVSKLVFFKSPNGAMKSLEEELRHWGIEYLSLTYVWHNWGRVKVRLRISYQWQSLLSFFYKDPNQYDSFRNNPDQRIERYRSNHAPKLCPSDTKSLPPPPNWT